MEEKEKINQEELDQEEQRITEEFPVTEAKEVQQPEELDGDTEDKKEHEESTHEEGGDAGEEISTRDKQKEIPEGDKLPGDGTKQTEVSDEKEEKVDQEKDLEAEVKTDSTVQDDAKEIVDEVIDKTDTPPVRTPEDLLAEIEDLKFEKETQEQINNFSKIVEAQRAEYERFQNDLEAKVKETLTRFGIPLNVDVEELKEVDPGKYQMLENVIKNAQLLDKEVTAQIKEPIIRASEDIVFRVAGAHMKKYGLTQDQYKEAAATFVNIMNEVGIKDLGDDLKSKAELAVARAKMLVQETKEPVKKETKEDVKETPEQVIKETGKKLDDYTKSLNPGKVGGAAEVNEANVMQLYFSKQGDDRVAFLQKHKDLIMDQLKKKGMPYNDDKRRW